MHGNEQFYFCSFILYKKQLKDEKKRKITSINEKYFLIADLLMVCLSHIYECSDSIFFMTLKARVIFPDQTSTKQF